MSDNLFTSARLTLDHARDHIKELNERLSTFLRSNEGTRAVEPDPKTGEDVHKLRFRDRMPGKIHSIGHDAISNMRDVLDQAVFASTVALKGEKPTTGRKEWRTKFPFGDDFAAAERDLEKRGGQDVPSEIKSLLLGFKPYREGGDRTLWAFNQLRNSKTHRVLIPLRVSTGDVVMSGGSIVISNAKFTEGSLIRTTPGGEWNAAENAIEYLRLPANTKADYNLNLSFFIALSDVDDSLCKPAVPLLIELSNTIERILVTVEAETRRLRRSHTSWPF